MDTPQRLMLLLTPANYLTLSLSASTVVEDAIVGTVVGGILGKTPGSTLSLTDSASGKFAIVGTNVEVAGALDYETATSHNITIRETIPGRGPKDTVVVITVTDVGEGLANLIANGGFDDTSAWTLGSDAAISDGTLSFFPGSGTAAQDTLTPVVEGLFYKADYTLSMAGGTPALSISLGAGNAGATRTADGAYSEYLRAGATQELLLSGIEFSVDDVFLSGPIATPLNVELCPDPGFDDAGAWTMGGSGAISVTGGQLVATGGIGNRSATCAPDGYPLNAGTYDVTFTIVARTAGSVRVEVCGVLGTNRNAVGTHNEQIVVADADTAFQTILVRMITSPNMTVDDVSVKKIA